MLDPKCLRSDIEQTAKRLAARGFDLDVATFSSLEEKEKHFSPEHRICKTNATYEVNPLVKRKHKAKILPLYLLKLVSLAMSWILQKQSLPNY